ncbi:MAG: YifB family Mg chelatase-like AAA ATPase [Gammaproteobacteria bacterium]|nr:YifB family Mg chelatase-like AAA ATPase [Gammaproteobacteria bacterium]
MSLSIIKSRNAELEAAEVFIEVHLANGLPCISMVGLAETAVKESKDRVRGAISNCEFEFPIRRITINLAPADLPKESSRFDLAIAIGILSASKQIRECDLHQYEFYGELALSGELRPVKGIIAAAVQAKATKKTIIIPKNNVPEASLIHGLNILYAEHLLEVTAFLNGMKKLAKPEKFAVIASSTSLCFSDVRGQQHAKRALTIAAAGNHSILMSGSPGSGKTMLASRIPDILPEMTEQQAMMTASIRSINGEQVNVNNWSVRPFRSPHHTASAVALVGGGSYPKPGEISLAHNGVLFLDELPEFSRHVLEVLREPLESGVIHISRAARQTSYPANFQLVAAMNPCPCGYLGDSQHHCRCTSEQVLRYQSKLSGPLLDRIDLFIKLSSVPKDELFNLKQENKPSNSVTYSESSKTIQQKVISAHQKQIKRAGKANSQLTNKELEIYCPLSENNKQLLDKAVSNLKLSARAFHRILRVAKTIADLDEEYNAKVGINNEHISEALQYRHKSIENVHG